MNKLQKLNLKLIVATEEFQRQILSIHEEKVSLIQKRVIKCSSCGKGSHLGRWGFIQDHWYTRPCGCTGGDHWNTSQTKVCQIVCPECSAMNYIFNHHQREQIVDLVDGQDVAKKEVFSIIWDRHGNSELKQVYPEV